MRRILSLLVVAGVGLAPAGVRAQSLAAGSPGGARVEGPGIALGERLVLHLGISTELRFDSNVFYETDNVTSALALRLTPAFAIATKNPQRTLGPDGTPAPHK